MLEHLPPRRDPRPLVLLPTGATVAYAALDAWEVRALGQLPAHRGRGLDLALARLLLQHRPTAIVVAGAHPAALARSLGRVARPRGLPILMLDAKTTRTLTAKAPSIAAIRAQFPEVRGLAAADLLPALPLAVALLTHLTLPPRSYARLPAHPAPRLGARGRKRPRPA